MFLDDVTLVPETTNIYSDIKASDAMHSRVALIIEWVKTWSSDVSKAAIFRSEETGLLELTLYFDKARFKTQSPVFEPFSQGHTDLYCVMIPLGHLECLGDIDVENFIQHLNKFKLIMLSYVEDAGK